MSVCQWWTGEWILYIYWNVLINMNKNFDKNINERNLKKMIKQEIMHLFLLILINNTCIIQFIIFIYKTWNHILYK